MYELILTSEQRASLAETVSSITSWSREHQIEMGLVEMAAGASLIQFAVNAGVITVGQEILATAFQGGPSNGAVMGGLSGSSLGALAGWMIGSIGVAAMGGAVGVPASAIVLGGSFVLGAVGYTAGDLVHQYVHAIDYGKFALDAGALALGVALIIDGARRIAVDKRLRKVGADLADGVVYLGTLSVPVVARSRQELNALYEAMFVPGSALDAAGTLGSSIVVATGGAVLGSTLAASTVTVAGSQTLGALALTLWLVSAPVWPAIIAGAVGAGVGVAGWKWGRAAFAPER